MSSFNTVFEAGYFITLQSFHDFLMKCFQPPEKGFDVINSLREIIQLTVEEPYVQNYIKLTYYEHDLFLFFATNDMSKPHIKMFYLHFLQYQLQALSMHLNDIILSRPVTPISHKRNNSDS